MEIFIDEMTAESWEKFTKTETFETLRKGKLIQDELELHKDSSTCEVGKGELVISKNK